MDETVEVIYYMRTECLPLLTTEPIGIRETGAYIPSEETLLTRSTRDHRETVYSIASREEIPGKKRNELEGLRGKSTLENGLVNYNNVRVVRQSKEETEKQISEFRDFLLRKSTIDSKLSLPK